MYYESGKLRTVKILKDGKFVSEKVYDEKGKLIKEK
jgi:antitoxin component YwqK of YwqJK toxin-antitoxin module